MSIRPIIIIDDPVVKTKERTITIYRQELFEDMDAESIKFTELRPDLPSHQSDIMAEPNAVIQHVPYTLSKARVVTVSKQSLFEDLDAETRKFSEMRPDSPASHSEINPTVMIQSSPYSLVKDRLVTIYKQKLYDDIDAESYKYAEARTDANPQQANATGSDTAERLDGHIISRLAESCDSRLRKRLNQFLKNTTVVESDDNEMGLEESFLYNFCVSTEFNDSMMSSLTKHIHHYLVWGVLYDWYGASLGSDQAKWFRDNIAETEKAIVRLVACIDGHLAVRHLEFADAKLRKRLLRFLDNSQVITSAENGIDLGPSFVYTLTLSTEFNDSQMGALASHINRYLVWSALYDWYGASIGSEQAKWFQQTLKETEDAIIKLVARIDGHLAVRHLKFRDARLRRRMSTSIKNADEIIVTDDKLNLEATFVYDLVVPLEFRDSMLDPLKEYIHRYLVWGALYDWYGSSLGSSQANFYKGELVELENAIVGLVTMPNTAKRPLQPFGPAQKIY